jgi:hypothetical protein
VTKGTRALGQGVLASALIILTACSGETPAGVAVRPTSSGSPEWTVAGIPLYPLPPKLVKACREEQRRAPILCPSVFPRRSVQPPIRWGSQSLDLGRGLHGIELGYSAPYENAPGRNRPARFLHFVIIVRTGRAHYGSTSEWEARGARRFGEREGVLYFVPEFSIHYQHLLFAWDEDGLEYQASLHSWDDETQTTELLGALVAGLESPDQL